MKAMFVFFPLMATFSVFGADSKSSSIEELASHYADFLTNVTFRQAHPDIFNESLDSIRNSDNFSPEAMAMALVPIVKRGIASTNGYFKSMAIDAINTMGYFKLTNTVHFLRERTLCGDFYSKPAFCSYARIVQYGADFLDLGLDAVNCGAFDMAFLAYRIDLILSLDKKLCLQVPLEDKNRFRMQQLLLDHVSQVPPSGAERDIDLCKLIPGYSNSVERIAYLHKIQDSLDKVSKPRDGIRQLYLFDNKAYEYDDWTNRIRTRCEGELVRIQKLPEANSVSVAEIIRTKSIPEDERLNMMAILDAKIAAIEADEVRAARRAVWKRRLRIGGYVLLPFLGIVVVVIVALRRRSR